MEDFALINTAKLPQMLMKLPTAECKMMLYILYYLSSNNKEHYVNNATTREYLASMDFARTPERISAILSSMTKRGILIREAPGVYSVSGNLFLPASMSKE